MNRLKILTKQYIAPFNLLLLPLGTNEEAEKKIIEHFEEVKRCIDKLFYFYKNKRYKNLTF